MATSKFALNAKLWGGYISGTGPMQEILDFVFPIHTDKQYKI